MSDEHSHREHHESQAVLLARIDQRTLHTELSLAELKKSIENQYVTQDEFRPVRSIVFGMVGTILVAVIGAIIALVVRTAPGAVPHAVVTLPEHATTEAAP